MTSEKKFTLVSPHKCGLRWFRISTEEQAREAFYSHERRIRLGGRGELVPSNSTQPVFIWKCSPTFGSPLPSPQIGTDVMRKQDTIITTSIRMEFIMIAYTYVIEMFRNVAEEYTALMARPHDEGTARVDIAELRDMASRLYTAYLILVDRIKPHVIMHTLGSIFPVCAELSVHTADAMIALVVGYHSIIALTTIDRVKGVSVTYEMRRDVFLLVAQQYERTYSILTQHVWIIYGAGSEEQTAFQRYLLGSILFHRAKVFICAVEHERHKKECNPKLVSVLAHKAEYLLRILKSSEAFGYMERAGTLCTFIVNVIADVATELRVGAFYTKKIANIEEYKNGDRFMEFAINEDAAIALLYTHRKKMGRTFRSIEKYCTLPKTCLFVSSAESPTLPR